MPISGSPAAASEPPGLAGASALVKTPYSGSGADKTRALASSNQLLGQPLGLQAGPGLVEDPRPGQAQLGRPILHAGPEHPQPVPARPPQVDRGRLRLVARRAGDLANPEAEPESLGQDLVVEHEVIGVRL